jgi:hypothetical protein
MSRLWPNRFQNGVIAASIGAASEDFGRLLRHVEKPIGQAQILARTGRRSTERGMGLALLLGGIGDEGRCPKFLIHNETYGCLKIEHVLSVNKRERGW